MISSAKQQKPVIKCQYNTNFVFDKIGQLVIQQLMFVGCGNNRVLSCPNFTVANSMFIGQNGSGTALELINTAANIYSNSFAFNMFGSYRGPVGIVKYWKGTANKFVYVGGAIIANQSNVTLVTCYFEGNIAHIGGALYSTMGSIITVVNCIFVRNFAFQRFDFYLPAFGGAIHCENGKSSNNQLLFCLMMCFTTTVHHVAELSVLLTTYSFESFQPIFQQTQLHWKEVF